MKEIDDTDPPKSESEQMFEHVSAAVDELNRQLTAQLQGLGEQINDLELRIANLETQRTPEMENDDPEWFS